MAQSPKSQPNWVQAKFAATEARLAGLTVPQCGAWATTARAAAQGRVRTAGLPSKRDEYWRYTDPQSLVVADVPAAAALAADDEAIFDGIDKLTLTFVDGVFAPDLSDDPSGEGLEIERLADAAAKDIHWIKDLYGVLEARGQVPVPRPLAAFNTAFATDGIVIRVTRPVTTPVHINYVHVNDTSDATLHHVVRIEAGASLTLLEAGPAAARFSKVLEVDIANTAAFHHIRTQGRDHDRRAMTHIFAQLGEASVFKSFTMTVNGVLTRNDCVIELLGADAVAHVAGVCVGDGGDFHHDDTVFVTHDAERCESRQVFKKVLRNGATGVFQGKILVKAGAQKTDGYQISQSLLLGDDSQFYVKPELEIYADDVACSHGSTSGAIDETALFYMRARGMPEVTAKQLLTLAFLAEALDEIEDPDLAERLQSRLSEWMERRG